MLNTSSKARRAIPAVDALLKAPAFVGLVQEFGRLRVVDAVVDGP